MITKVVKGDLIHLAKQGRFDAIVHGCNCQGVMGAGIAPQIAKAFVGVREADNDFEIPLRDVRRLGKYSKTYQEEIDTWVINAYTQFDIRGRSVGKPDVNYRAITRVFTSLNGEFRGKTLGIPRIGAGLACGHWEAISEIINLTTPDVKIILVEYQP